MLFVVAPLTREGTPIEHDPSHSIVKNDGHLEAGFKTFSWDMPSLREGGVTTYGTSSYTISGITYKFETKVGNESPEKWLVYEIQELNQCTKKNTIEAEWLNITSNSTVGKTGINSDPFLGEIRRYDRVLPAHGKGSITTNVRFPRTLEMTHRVEAGLILNQYDRIYILTAFQLITLPQPGDDRSDEILDALRNKREHLLQTIKFMPGQSDMCAVISSKAKRI